MRLASMTALAISLLVPLPAVAQGRSFEIGGQIAIAESEQFGEQDIGVGVRFGWAPTGRLLGLEAELTLYPSDFPGARRPLSSSRVEGLFGATVGPRLGSIRPFGKVRPGFLRFQEAPGPIACVAIFPPPLSCQLAAGRTLFALDIGGGIDVAIGRATLFRVDVGDRLVRYPAPYAMGHDVRVGIGGAIRF